MRRGLRWAPAGAAVVALGLAFSAGSPVPERPHDVLVTDDHSGGTYVRFDGTSDPVTDLCGTARLPQTEPSVAVDPSDPRVIAVGANDECVTRFGDLWMGYYRSADGGRTWTRTLVPGYGHDRSRAGRTSPIHGSCHGASDPALSFDARGRLFYGFLCFGLGRFERGSIFVAEFDDHGSRYVGTVPVRRAGSTGFEDKPALAVDETGGPHSGSVYAVWTDFGEFQGRVEFCQAVFFARSTDRGASFQPAHAVSGKVCAFFADVAVGPDGTIWVTFRNGLKIWVTSSRDGGATFARPQGIANINPFEAGDFIIATRECGDGPTHCPRDLTYPRFTTNPSVVADRAGVHVAWSSQNHSGRGRVVVKTSADGRDWTAAPVPVDRLRVGHEWMPDIATDGASLDVVFLDSRDDPSYAKENPPGETASGHNSGNVVETYLARSADGGRTWTERRLSATGSNQNWEVSDFARRPFYGDYLSVSAVPGGGFAAWPDSRDLVPGSDPRESGPGEDHDGFDGYLPCDWTPSTIDADHYTSVGLTQLCLSAGGLDLNIYGAPT